MGRPALRGAARAVYAGFGALAVGLGVLALVAPSLALPPAEASPLTTHLVREQGAGGVCIGLISFWCLFHVDSPARRPVHLALLVFAGLFAAVHWIELVRGRRGIASPLVNSVPLAAFLATVPAGRPTRGGGKSDG